nr:immunoglobulin light chain junction region [Macaca mulatta]MPN84845.1 immunoglobulin light chain junction region [Macaca mulatta]MPN84847.1 immunoglobulin light chain junction region [Macaca mulatta]MPN84849.1 immunoglobulin light chain junction region [Macaca mulatta]MPN84853.1 immunoglobulin light chain junction region [Macaca mulatta]
CQQYTNSPFSF